MSEDDYPIIHGDPGHSCYDENGELTCVVGKMLGFGPSWREMMEACETWDVEVRE